MTALDAREERDDRHVVSVAKGAGFLAGGRLFSFALRFGMAVLLARSLEVDDYGLYILAISVIAAAANLASLGLDAAMERYLAIQARHRDGPGIRGTVQIGLWITVVTSSLLGVALAVFAEPIAEGIFDEPKLVPLLRLAALITPALAVSTLLTACIRGFKRMDLAALAQDVVQPISRFVLIIVMGIAGLTAFRASVAFGLSYVVVLFVLLHLVGKRVRDTAQSPGTRRETREILWFSFPFWFSGIMRLTRTLLQPLLLGAFGTVANVGLFSVVTSANMLGRIANASIRTASRPTLAELQESGDVTEIGRLYATTTRWTLAANLPVFLAIVLAPASLLAVFGEDFTDGVTPLVIVACAELINAATGQCGPIIAMSGYNKLKLANSFVWMAASVAASVLLIPPFGVVGAAVAIVVSTTTINVIRVIEVWVLLRVLPWDRHIWKPIVAALGTAVLAGLVLSVLPDVLGFGLLIAILVGIAVCYFGLLVVLGLEPDDRLLLARLRRNVKRRRRPGDNSSKDEATNTSTGKKK